MRSRRRHLYALAELVERHGDVELCRDEYLAALDADDGLVVLLISADEIRAGGRRAPGAGAGSLPALRRATAGEAAPLQPLRPRLPLSAMSFRFPDRLSR